MKEKVALDIGKKVRILAWVYLCISTIAFIVLGISMMALASSNNEVKYIIGLATLFVGPIISWLSSLFIFAVGDLLKKIKN